MTKPPRSQTNWQIPRELPDLRRVGIVALDTETRRRGVARQARLVLAVAATAMSAASASPGAQAARFARIYVPLRHPDSDNFDPDEVYPLAARI